MKEEIRRVMKLVQEGKLSPEDAAELIDALQNSPEVGRTGQREAEGEEVAGASPPPPPSGLGDDPIKSFFDTIEKVGKDVAQAVNWNEVSQQLKVGARKGVDAVREAVNQVREGKGPFVFWALGEQTEVTVPLDIKPGKILRIENGHGDVRVTGGAETGQVIARATVRGSDSADAKRKAQEYTLVVEEGDGFVLIRQPDMTGLSVDLDIQVAGRPQLDVRVEAGDVTVIDTRSSAKVTARSGDVRLTGVEGIVEVSVGSGDVAVGQMHGSTLSVESKSGDVHLSKVKAAIHVRSSSGDVTLGECGGRAVSVETASGDVNIDLVDPVEGAVNVRTVHGDARLTVTGGNCRVALSTLRGHAHCGLSLADENRAEGRITGRLGEGAGSLDVSAINGDVLLSLRDSSSTEAVEDEEG